MQQHEAIARQLASLGGGDYERALSFVEAVARISPDLLPRIDHPLAGHIAAGPAAFPDLMQRLEDEEEIEVVVDAISRIVERHVATEPIMEALRRVARTDNVEVASLAAKALALGGDRELLEGEHRMLSSPSLGRVRTAAHLLGWGRWRPAIPDLMRLLQPFRVSIADAVLWSLGEIGDPSALPALHAFLETGSMLRESVEACGKIGSERSIRYLIPILEHALAVDRASAARAMGMIAVRTGATLDPTLMSALRSALSRAIDRDDDKSVRYHAIIASARLGEPIDPRRISRALDVQLPAKQLDPMAAFFTKRGD